jgi:hypothetical protein
MTLRLANVYQDCVKGKIEKYQKWLTYVNE